MADGARVHELIRKGETARLLAVWIVLGFITLKFAIRSVQGFGMYHEKIGTFRDQQNNCLAISGSTNESRTAWALNFERIDLFSSWASPESSRRCRDIASSFDSLWKNDTAGLRVVSLQEALLEGLLVVRPENSIPEGDVPKGSVVIPNLPAEVAAIPPDLKLFPHQELAIREWAANGGRGIMALATGSGKTVTALALASKLAAKVDTLVIVIVAPFIHLVDQWIENARDFGLRPIRVAEGRANWERELANGVGEVNAKARRILSVVVTQATLTSSAHFSELLGRIRAPMLIIGDEVHNYGTQEVFNALPAGAAFRVGLSATPSRYRDPEGTLRIENYFGRIVTKYSLADAIRDEVLTPYKYYPILCSLDASEMEQYLDLTKKLARFPFVDSDEPASNIELALYLKRARLVATASSKFTKLRALLVDRRSESHILVYCGDGQVEGDVPEEQVRQVQAVIRMIGNELGMRCAAYTAETPPARRRDLLTQFADGTIQVLVAIRCLDEGVDVPATRTAIILASSTNPRQFIQRRGRILRRFEGKSRADLYDFVVCPDPNAFVPGSSEERVMKGLLRRELQRVSEFAELSLNGPVARRELGAIVEKLKVHEGWQGPTNSTTLGGV